MSFVSSATAKRAAVPANDVLPDSSLAPYASVRWKPTSVYCVPAVVVSLSSDIGFHVAVAFRLAV